MHRIIISKLDFFSVPRVLTYPGRKGGWEGEREEGGRGRGVGREGGREGVKEGGRGGEESERERGRVGGV